jgi:hypothetical protein
MCRPDANGFVVFEATAAARWLYAHAKQYQININDIMEENFSLDTVGNVRSPIIRTCVVVRVCLNSCVYTLVFACVGLFCADHTHRPGQLPSHLHHHQRLAHAAHAGHLLSHILLTFTHTTHQHSDTDTHVSNLLRPQIYLRSARN